MRVVIPARYNSMRFPGKLLADLHGFPVIQYAVDNACLSDALEVLLVTDDFRIADAVIDPHTNAPAFIEII